MGTVLALLAYLWWACSPIYWRYAPGEPLELVGHRVVWSLAFLLPIVALRGKLGVLWGSLRSPRGWLVCGIDGWLAVANWLVYVWAISNDRILDTSLGYFLSPLVSIALAGIFEKERLSKVQLVAVGFAVAGVAVMASRTGTLPLPSLGIAFTWGFYSLVKRRTPLGPITSLSHEVLAVFPFALAGLIYSYTQGGSLLNDAPLSVWIWLVSTGVITALPLLAYAGAAKRVSLTSLGLYQYMVPTITMLIATVGYHEPFPPYKAVAFGLIWAGLILYTGERLLAARRQRHTLADDVRNEELPQ
ncbi:MAG: chloramphenicol-sensitive protein RarD [Puniceicoccaceae bacterium 5H]|nr:MAG: chloramphenicol-sensitive protein RarD [Puniceicoccaceae bacterium 5H]